jgi:hypothetical protein
VVAIRLPTNEACVRMTSEMKNASADIAQFTAACVIRYTCPGARD